jgi:hypothetical protein
MLSEAQIRLPASRGESLTLPVGVLCSLRSLEVVLDGSTSSPTVLRWLPARGHVQTLVIQAKGEDTQLVLDKDKRRLVRRRVRGEPTQVNWE